LELSPDFEDEADFDPDFFEACADLDLLDIEEREPERERERESILFLDPLSVFSFSLLSLQSRFLWPLSPHK